MLIPLNHFLIFSLLLFSIGIYGALVRRNIIGILLSIELMLNAVNVNLIAFAKTTSLAPETGQIFALFIIAIAATAAAVGLAIVGMAIPYVTGLLAGDEVVTHGAYSLAFAGKGSVSLKEALDAAHGHAHNEDGSEMSKEHAAAGGHDHDHGDENGEGWSMMTTFFAASTGLLLLLLILSVATKRNSATA